jgi:hypothetical protein
VLTLTFDTNCIVALDEDREPDAACIRRLLAFHDQGKVKLRLTSSSASERQQDLTYLSNFDQFEARIEALGLAKLERLLPPATLDVSYLDNAVLAGDDHILLMDRIHQVLFPGHRSDLSEVLEGITDEADRLKAEGGWRNRLMDVHALWCHTNYGGDVFVTTDKRFSRKLALLSDIQPSLLIKAPCDAASYVGAP